MPKTLRFTLTKYRKSNSIRCNKSATYHIDQSNAKHGCSRGKNQRLEAMMLLDPHVKYAKSIGIEDTKIRYALLQQMEKNNCNFSNCQELHNLILDIKKEDKCMKCKNKKKTQFACLVNTSYFAGPVYKTSILVGCALKACPKQSASNNGNCTRV